MSMIQQDFFADTPEKLATLEVFELRKEVSNLRRGMFSRHGEIYKALSDLQKTVDLLNEEINRIKNDQEIFQKII